MDLPHRCGLESGDEVGFAIDPNLLSRVQDSQNFTQILHRGYQGAQNRDAAGNGAGLVYGGGRKPSPNQKMPPNAPFLASHGENPDGIFGIHVAFPGGHLNRRVGLCLEAIRGEISIAHPFAVVDAARGLITTTN